MPPNLAKKLRTIRDEVFLCRDVDGRWAEWGSGELQAAEADQFEEHLAACHRCRSLCAALDTALSAGRLQPVPLPTHLRARLQRIPAPRRRIPWWLADVRVALAASYLLALCVTFGASAAGKAPSLGKSSGEALVRSVTTVGEEVNDRARQALAAGGRLGTELQRVAEDVFSIPLESNPEDKIPAENLRPSNEERR